MVVRSLLLALSVVVILVIVGSAAAEVRPKSSVELPPELLTRSHARKGYGKCLDDCVGDSDCKGDTDNKCTMCQCGNGRGQPCVCQNPSTCGDVCFGPGNADCLGQDGHYACQVCHIPKNNNMGKCGPKHRED